jgi:hypothetical protein
MQGDSAQSGQPKASHETASSDYYLESGLLVYTGAYPPETRLLLRLRLSPLPLPSPTRRGQHKSARMTNVSGLKRYQSLAKPW